jgi:hypothetical protein
MRLFLLEPATGKLPEVRTYRCEQCGDLKGVEIPKGEG